MVRRRRGNRISRRAKRRGIHGTGRGTKQSDPFTQGMRLISGWITQTDQVLTSMERRRVRLVRDIKGYTDSRGAGDIVVVDQGLKRAEQAIAKALSQLNRAYDGIDEIKFEQGVH